MPYGRVLVEVEPDHLDRPFDYEIAESTPVGARVEVTFGGRRTRGIVTDISATTDVEQVRPVRKVLGEHTWLTADELEVVRWAADRYAAPAADVIRHALPNRVVDVERRAAAQGWYPAAPRPPYTGARPDPNWGAYGAGDLADVAAHGSGAYYLRPLPSEDLPTRLVELVTHVLAHDRDVLLVVPGPRSSSADAVAAVVGDLAVDVRGGAKERRTYRAWLAARTGKARVVIGERGVAFWPLTRLGLAIVLDEASPALKERRSPYHNAREVVLERARRVGAVCLLVGYLPSALAWRLLVDRRVTPLVAPRRRERAAAPTVHVDTQPGTRLGRRATEAVRRATREGELAVVLSSRRGEGHALACSACGLRLTCRICEASVRRASPGTFCPSCGDHNRSRPVCERCQGQRFAPLAAGAERLGEELTRSFPEVSVAVLEGYGHDVPQPPAIVVTTRGSVTLERPADVGVVVVPHLDALVRRPGLDASEDALRLALTAGAWTNEVIVQTGEPTHPVVQALIRWDPGGFWKTEAATRAELRFPPAASSVRIDTGEGGTTTERELRQALPSSDELLGPLPVDGRSVWLIKTDDRVTTVAALRPLRHAWSRASRDVRIEVDPIEVP
ncbi:MAG: hypothetical protein KY469_12930 [Actinobacteria bacterium]|nr:hypothetical protein [Actinomycetota bacterium]